MTQGHSTGDVFFPAAGLISISAKGGWTSYQSLPGHQTSGCNTHGPASPHPGRTLRSFPATLRRREPSIQSCSSPRRRISAQESAQIPCPFESLHQNADAAISGILPAAAFFHAFCFTFRTVQNPCERFFRVHMRHLPVIGL